MREPNPKPQEWTKELWLQHEATMIVLKVKVKVKMRKLPTFVLWLEKWSRK